jgi:hypothetical protein
MSCQDECFEKPGGVSEMPFGGAAIGHGLQHLVFCRERLREFQAFLANCLILLSQRTTSKLCEACVHTFPHEPEHRQTENADLAWMRDRALLLHFS